jgi:integrase
MLTLFHTGVRVNELVGLQWPDIDFRNRFVVVRRQLKKDGSVGKTKQRKLRKVDISDTLIRELQTVEKQRREEYFGRGKPQEMPEWVFLSPGQRETKGKRKEGKPLDMDNWSNRVFQKACDQAKIRRRGPHHTRHTFASILLMNGESPAYVKDQLGHSSIKMTVDVYGHFIPGANRQAVNKLPSLSTPKAATKAASG